MKSVRRIQRAFLIALIATGGAFLLYGQMRQGLIDLERAGVRQLAASFAPLFEKAYREQDDVATTELLKAVSQAPGIQTAKMSEQGTLKLSLSNHLRHKITRRLGILVLFLCGTFAVLSFGVLEYFNSERSRLQNKISETQSLLEKEQWARKEGESTAQKRQQELRHVLRAAMGSVERPLVVLDEHQRVAALSPAALQSLHIASEESVLHKSWLEVPLLEHCASDIETAFRSTQEVHSDKLKVKRLGQDWLGISVE